MDARRRTVATSLLALLCPALLLSGCSFVFVDRPKPNNQTCTESYLWPIVDTTMAGLFTVVAVDFATMSKEEYLSKYANSGDKSDGRTGTAATGFVMAGAAAASAIYGYINVSRCSPTRTAAWTPERAQAYAPPASYPMPAPQLPPPSAPMPPAPVPMQPERRLAVLEFQGRELDPSFLMRCTDAVRFGMHQGLGSYGVTVMSREHMKTLLKPPANLGCLDDTCELVTARSLSAAHVVSGRVAYAQGLYVVTLKVRETQGGILIVSDTIDGRSEPELLKILAERSRDLARSAFGFAPAR
jgi:hypothetical protein